MRIARLIFKGMIPAFITSVWSAQFGNIAEIESIYTAEMNIRLNGNEAIREEARQILRELRDKNNLAQHSER